MNDSKKQYDLLDLLEIMKQHKCLKVKLGAMEIELSPMAFIKEISEDDISKMMEKSNLQPKFDEPNYNMTEEEMLRIASPFPFKK